ncbi:unnamed protein product [Discula destructiva]
MPLPVTHFSEAYNTKKNESKSFAAYGDDSLEAPQARSDQHLQLPLIEEWNTRTTAASQSPVGHILSLRFLLNDDPKPPPPAAPKRVYEGARGMSAATSIADYTAALWRGPFQQRDTNPGGPPDQYRHDGPEVLISRTPSATPRNAKYTEHPYSDDTSTGLRRNPGYPLEVLAPPKPPIEAVTRSFSAVQLDPGFNHFTGKSHSSFAWPGMSAHSQVISKP